MSSISFDQLFPPTALLTTNETIYTVTGASSVILRDAVIRVVNNTERTHLLTLYAVPKGESSSIRTALARDYALPKNNYKDFDIPELLLGDRIRAFIDSTGNVTVHYMTGSLYNP